MAEPVARIRPFQASDDKVVRFAIGKANMESLAVANRRGRTSFTLSISYYMFNTYFFHRLRPPLHDCRFLGVILHIHIFHEYVADEHLRLPGLSSTAPPDGRNSCSNYGIHRLVSDCHPVV